MQGLRLRYCRVMRTSLLNVCLFVYFHQLSVTMNNNKVEGSNRDKTMKKQKLKEKFTPFDDDGAKVHCSLANSVLAP